MVHRCDVGAAVCLVSTSCVDEIKFGNSFLDKAPGGNATIDTVFNSAEYTRQFLNTCYSRQYYGYLIIRTVTVIFLILPVLI